jgi:hypothetical protein
MATPTKSNKTATPLTVQPGSPHWVTPSHGIASRGPGYDFHDPVSLQQATGTGGYDSGNAITQYGTVEFQDTIVNISHGTVYDLDILRKFGHQGDFEFWVTWDPTSTGLLGDFRTDVEHGFDISTIDLDLVTLNHGVTADPDGKPRVKIRFVDGEVKKSLQAVATYRTNVRSFDPVVLQKPYTYWVKERFNAFAGNDERALMEAHGGPWADPTYLPGCESVVTGYKPFKYELQNIRLVDEAAFQEPTSNAYEYRSEVQQHWTHYKLLSLPVPEFFIDPTLVGSPAVPGKESWKNDFSFYDHENLIYTVGNTYDCVAITRVYVNSQGGTTGGRTGAPSLDVLPCCKNNLGQCVHDSKGSWFSRTPPWVGGTSFEPPRDVGILGRNMHQAGLTDSWTEPFDFKYSPLNKFSSGYESVKDFAFGADKLDFWSHDYSGWVNAPAGELMLLGQPPEDIKIDSGFNMIFNWVGTEDGNNLANGYSKVCIDETTVANLSGAAKGFDRVPYKTYESWVAQTGDDYGWVPFDNYNGRAGSGGIDFPHDKNTVVAQLVNWYETMKPPVERWAYHENTVCGQPGMGESGTSNTLYDLTALTHDLATYQKNNTLKGYYKCCTDHVDRQVKLHLSKVNENDLVELGTNITQSTFINKSSLYSVPSHGSYDNTVNIYHGMPPGKVFEPFQAWDDVPTGDSLTKQLFTSLGADDKSPVLFLSLSAGGFAGGTNPTNGIPRSRPKTKPVMRPSTRTVREVEVPGATVNYVVQFVNVGGDDSKITFENSPSSGFRSTTNTPYGPIGTTGPTFSGDKLDDWAWSFVGTPRLVPSTTTSVHLSANEIVEVQYTVNINTANPNGYNIWHGYQFDRGVLYGGVINDKTSFQIAL